MMLKVITASGSKESNIVLIYPKGKENIFKTIHFSISLPMFQTSWSRISISAQQFPSRPNVQSNSLLKDKTWDKQVPVEHCAHRGTPCWSPASLSPPCWSPASLPPHCWSSNLLVFLLLYSLTPGSCKLCPVTMLVWIHVCYVLNYPLTEF